MKKRFSVMVIRGGCVEIEAETKQEALAEFERYDADDISWDEDWQAAEVCPKNEFHGCLCECGECNECENEVMF